MLSRHGELVVLCSAAQEHGDVVDAVLAAHEQVAHARGDGTALADRLAAVLADSAGDLGVVAFGPVGESLAVAVFGHAWADVTTEHGEQRLALRQSHNGVRSMLPGLLLSVRAGLGDIDADTEPQRWGNLEHGSVHAGGLLYVATQVPEPVAAKPAQADSSGPLTAEIPAVTSLPSVPPAPPAAVGSVGAPAPAARGQHQAPDFATEGAPGAPVGTSAEAEMPTSRIAAEPIADAAPADVTARPDLPAVAPPDMPVVAPPEPAVDRSQSFSSVVLFGTAAAEPQAPERPPLPIAAPPEPVAPEVAPAPHPVEDGSVRIMGVYCKNGHFDDPTARYCAICGISMAQQTLLPRLGPRPPLGVLVLDDGSIFSLDTDYIIGRHPVGDSDVMAGTARPLRIEDADGVLSRVHARIRLEGWQVQVVDLGSANGTGLWGPGDTTWHRIPPQTPVAIAPGTQVGFGRRQLRYESHRNT
ncbi:MAG: FHA domain-containing protein [Jatrophihabitantaceae bacterium]